MAKSKSATSARVALTNPPVSTQTNLGKFQLPAGFVVRRKITLPTLVMKEIGKTHLIRFENPITLSTVDTGKVDADGKKEKPANVAHVIDLDSGEEMTLLVPALVQANLERDYEGEGYVGKSFMFTNNGKREGKRYVVYTIAEIGEE